MWKEMPSKYWRKPREIQVIAAVKWSCKWEVTQVANGRWPKTASCRATDEDEWVTPTSVASPRTQFSNKHQLLMITIEIFWVLWLQSFFPSSWGVRSPDPHRRLGRGTWLTMDKLVSIPVVKMQNHKSVTFLLWKTTSGQITSKRSGACKNFFEIQFFLLFSHKTKT